MRSMMTGSLDVMSRATPVKSALEPYVGVENVTYEVARGGIGGMFGAGGWDETIPFFPMPGGGQTPSVLTWNVHPPPKEGSKSF